MNTKIEDEMTTHVIAQSQTIDDLSMPTLEPIRDGTQTQRICTILLAGPSGHGMTDTRELLRRLFDPEFPLIKM